jgi:hypothetical protein
MEQQVLDKRESLRENRKDERIDKQAEHKKKEIEQKNKGESIKNFESSGNDVIGGGLGLERFDPR